MARLNFVELPTQDIGATKRFYERVFGWTLTDFGTSYSCTMTGDTDIGLQADPADVTKAPLPVIYVEDLEATLAALEEGGGRLTLPIFGFPGGRRFHFMDPSGNELAAMAAD